MKLRDVVIFFLGFQFFHTISHILIPLMMTFPIQLKMMTVTSGWNVAAIVLNALITAVLFIWTVNLSKK